MLKKVKAWAPLMHVPSDFIPKHGDRGEDSENLI